MVKTKIQTLDISYCFAQPSSWKVTISVLLVHHYSQVPGPLFALGGVKPTAHPRFVFEEGGPKQVLLEFWGANLGFLCRVGGTPRVFMWISKSLHGFWTARERETPQ